LYKTRHVLAYSRDLYKTQVIVLAEGRDMHKMPVNVPQSIQSFLDMKHIAALTQRPYNSNRDCICGNNFSLLAEGLDVAILRSSARGSSIFWGWEEENKEHLWQKLLVWQCHNPHSRW
jgi:hypothetical protein